MAIEILFSKFLSFKRGNEISWSEDDLIFRYWITKLLLFDDRENSDGSRIECLP